MIFFNDLQEDSNPSRHSVVTGAESRPSINTPLLDEAAEANFVNKEGQSARVGSKELITIQRVTKNRTYAKEKEIKQSIPKKIIFSLIFQLLFVALSYGCSFIPGIDIHFNNELSLHIEWSSFALYCLMVTFGFFYVTIVTCDRGRDCLKDRKKSYKSIVLLHIVTPFLFFSAPAYCMAAVEQADTYTTHFTLDHLFSSKLTNMDEVFIPFYNYVFYFLPFLLGLNFTILDSFPMLSRCGGNFNRGNCCAFKWRELVVMMFACSVMAVLTGLHLFMLYQEGLLLGYAVAYGALLLLTLAVSLVLRANWVFDTHHYFVALAFIPLSRFFNPLSTAFGGVALGVFVEGVGRWGFEFLWITKRDRELADWFKSVQIAENNRGATAKSP